MQHIIVENGKVVSIYPPLVITNDSYQGDFFMSFSFSANDTPAIVKVRVQGDLNMPQSIRDYVTAGVDALVETFGPDQAVAVSAVGHLHSPGNDTTTSASINVYKAPEQ